MSADHHNAHMFIPNELWQDAKRIAILQGTSMTEFVCHAIAAAIREYKKREDKR